MQFTEAVVNLKFDEEPKYAAYSSLFEPLCGATPARPILQTDAPKVQLAQFASIPTGTAYSCQQAHMLADSSISGGPVFEHLQKWPLSKMLSGTKLDMDWLDNTLMRSSLRSGGVQAI